jgi:YegS/Rv2252/BmrU family lipid kinase
VKATLIINPFSGRQKAPAVREMAERIAREIGADLVVRTIAGPGDGARYAREAVGAGVDRVICAGGDGTLNSVAEGLVGTRTALGILSFGSGNSYFSSLNLPRDPEKAIRLAFNGAALPADVCYLNDRLFVGTAGIGFDARVAAAFERSRRGRLSYFRIVLKEVFGAKPMRVVVNANHETREAQVLMMVFCNSREFGNGAIISPRSIVDDGVAELQIVSKPAWIPMIRGLYDLYTGKVDLNRNVHTVSAREATIYQEGTLAHLDGESAEIGHEIRFRLEAKKLWVVRYGAQP